MTTPLPPDIPIDPVPHPPTGRPRWLVPLVLAALALVALGATALVALSRSDGGDAVTGALPTSTASATTGPTAVPAPEPTPAVSGPSPVDCAVAPPAAAFTVGTTHACFSDMGERFVVWLGANTATTSASGYLPSDTFGAADTEHVSRVQRLMGDTPDGWLGSTQWTRLMTEDPPAPSELRPNGAGALWFGMTQAQLAARGAEVVADETGAFVDARGLVSPEAYLCFKPDELYAALVKGASPLRTVEGISTASTVEELKATYGSRLVTRDSPGIPGGVDYVVYAGDYGYVFIPQEDGSLMLLAGDRAFVADAGGGPHGLCGI